jgi:hypothetical protein
MRADERRERQLLEDKTLVDHGEIEAVDCKKPGKPFLQLSVQLRREPVVL